MSKIKSIFSREIIDSRGNPTVETEIILTDGSFGQAKVPSGASTGTKEACELRDLEARFSGKGVKQAVNNVNSIIANKLENSNADQKQIDQKLIELDNTANKSNLGANAILSVSMALARALAVSHKIPLWQYIKNICNFQIECKLPMPMLNVINGGVHADNKLDIQEFMIMPVGATSMMQALEMSHAVIHKLKSNLKKDNYSVNVGDEGGFAPSFSFNEQAIDAILSAIDAAGYIYNKDIAICLDFAASEFYREGNYLLQKGKKQLSSDEFVEYVVNLIKKYEIFSVEDPFAEDDWSSWISLTNKMKNTCQIVGDDLFVTNKVLLQQGIDHKAANAVLIKMNQIGTITETLQTIELAKQNKFNTIISHRSGETEDDFISDLSVGTAAMQIKTGSLCRTDRVAKYNQLLRISEKITTKLERPYVI